MTKNHVDGHRTSSSPKLAERKRISRIAASAPSGSNSCCGDESEIEERGEGIARRRRVTGPEISALGVKYNY